MEKEMPKMRVVDVQTRQTLFECPVQDSGKAYEFAARMEELGLDVEVINPTLSQTLSSSLGLGAQEVAQYEKSLEEELEHHEGSCCFEDPADGKIH